MKVIKKIGLAIIKNGKILLVRNMGTEKFLMPGGRVESDETDIQTLKREIMEELSVELHENTIKFIGIYEDVAANDPDSIVQIKLYTGEIMGQIKINNEIEEMRWFNPNIDDHSILSVIIKNKILPSIISKIIEDDKNPTNFKI